MAGGNWTSQNKVLPGVYINVKSRENIHAETGERGVVAIAEPLSWGRRESCSRLNPGRI